METNLMKIAMYGGTYNFIVCVKNGKEEKKRFFLRFSFFYVGQMEIGNDYIKDSISYRDLVVW